MNETHSYLNLKALGLLDQFAASDPTPGVGSALALSECIAASLVATVARLKIRKRSYESFHVHAEEILTETITLAGELKVLVNSDSEAFASSAILNLTSLFDQVGKTYDQLAHATGLSKGYIHRVINGSLERPGRNQLIRSTESVRRRTDAPAD